jgi:PKD repeat protein
LSGRDILLINADCDSTLRIVIDEAFYVWGGAPATMEYEGSGTFDTKMSSVPYDLTGTGITCEEVELPVANFTYFPENPVTGEEITFDASSSYDPDGTIVKYEWDFGDGIIVEGSGKPDKVSHRFRGAMGNSKDYTVKLTVEADKGATASDTASITVYPLKR